jgi:hypothetical protein
MVMAGIRNINTNGAVSNKGARVANLFSRILESANTNTNNPKITKKTAMEMYPIKELRKEFTSFLKIVHIGLF